MSATGRGMRRAADDFYRTPPWMTRELLRTEPLGLNILDAGAGADSMLWVDAGPWGWVWPVLLDPTGAAGVAEVLRSWATRDPETLWQELAAKPPPGEMGELVATWLALQGGSALGQPVAPGELRWSTRRYAHLSESGRAKGFKERLNVTAIAEGVAQWLWLQARSVNNVPVFWSEDLDGWEKGRRPGRGPEHAAEQGRGGRWEKAPHPGQSVTQRATQRGRWARHVSRPDQRTTATEEMRARGTTNGKPSGVQSPATIADRVEARWMMASARGYASRPLLTSGTSDKPPSTTTTAANVVRGARGPIEVLRCLVEEVEPPAGDPDLDFVYFDPPYEGRTGYGWGIDRESVVRTAARWHEAGWTVGVSEGVPLQIEDWHHLEITHVARGVVKGEEWLTISRPPAHVPPRQQPLFAPRAP